MKVALVASPGGHFYELLLLSEAFAEFEVIYITPKSPLSKIGIKNFIVENAGRNILKFIKVCFQIFLILYREKPRVIISSGAEIAIPAFYIGKLCFQMNTIYIETMARLVDPSLTGKIIYPISDIFLVQNKMLLNKYGNKARYYGALL